MSKTNIYIPTPQEDAQIQAGIIADPDAFEITSQMINSSQVVARMRQDTAPVQFRR